MSTNKHPKPDRPSDKDLEGDPGIGRSKGRFSRTDEPPLDGESTFEGDVGSDTTPEGGIDPGQTGRTNR